MRLIDADALIDEIKYITGQDTIMWFDDRKIKREQEVNMTAFIERMPTIDPIDIVEDYCHKRHLVVMTGELFEKIKREWGGWIK